MQKTKAALDRIEEIHKGKIWNSTEYTMIFQHMVHNISQISHCYYCKLCYCVHYIYA